MVGAVISGGKFCSKVSVSLLRSKVVKAEKLTFEFLIPTFLSWGNWESLVVCFLKYSSLFSLPDIEVESVAIRVVDVAAMTSKCSNSSIFRQKDKLVSPIELKLLVSFLVNQVVPSGHASTRVSELGMDFFSPSGKVLELVLGTNLEAARQTP